MTEGAVEGEGIGPAPDYDERALEPGDEGFEEAARKYGLWLPSGYEEDGTFYETFEHLALGDEGFEDTLEEVLERGLYASVRVPPKLDEERVLILETTVGEALAMTEEEFLEWAARERKKQMALLKPKGRKSTQ